MPNASITLINTIANIIHKLIAEVRNRKGSIPTQKGAAN
jgi:hypothetical protein